MSAANPAYTVRRQLMHRTTHADGCWEWRRGVDAQGFGLWPNTRRWVHVVAYEEFCGPVPDGQRVEQTCGNHRCWRPEHLTTERTDVR